MLDISQLEFKTEPYPQWCGKLKDSDLEICISGDSNSPNVRRIDVAQQSLPHIKTLEQQAKRHLHSFFRDSNSAGDWDTLWIEFGKNNSDPIDEFALYFSVGADDMYGLYHVTFCLSDLQKRGAFYPNIIAREDW